MDFQGTTVVFDKFNRQRTSFGPVWRSCRLIKRQLCWLISIQTLDVDDKNALSSLNINAQSW